MAGVLLSSGHKNIIICNIIVNDVSGLSMLHGHGQLLRHIYTNKQLVHTINKQLKQMIIKKAKDKRKTN